MKKVLTLLILSVLISILSSCMWQELEKNNLENVDKVIWKNAISHENVKNGTKKISWVSTKKTQSIEVSKQKWLSNIEKIWNSWRTFNK